MNKINRQREHFNSVADEYVRQRTGKRQKFLHKLIYTDLFLGIDVNQGRTLSVLEPMCGFGEGREIIKDHISRNILYKGFDLSERIVFNAKRIDPNIDVYIQDVTSYEPEEEYDIVILVGGLHHIPDYASIVMPKLYRSLRGGGYFISVEPTYNNWLAEKVCSYIYRKNKLFDEMTERRFSLREINSLYVKSGFKIVRQLHAGLLAYILWYNPDALPVLNVGNNKLVKAVYGMDRLVMDKWIGRALSVATFTVLKKNVY